MDKSFGFSDLGYFGSVTKLEPEYIIPYITALMLTA